MNSLPEAVAPLADPEDDAVVSAVPADKGTQSPVPDASHTKKTV
jgi:hypothetical protein